MAVCRPISIVSPFSHICFFFPRFSSCIKYCRPKVFKSSILWWIFWPKSNKRDWTRLHNDRIYSLYHLPNIVKVIETRRLRWTGHVARIELKSSFKMLTGEHTGKRPLWRPRHRWEDNIRMDLKVIGINMRNWVDLAQDTNYWRALVNAALDLCVP